MPRYFFDVQDGYPTRDEDGMVLNGTDAVVATAMRTLFEVGQLEAMRNDRHEFSVTVRNEAGAAIYRAALTVRAGWALGNDEKA